jgi:DUF4097 and DUF4098 domain-containing protein YvlB
MTMNRFSISHLHAGCKAAICAAAAAAVLAAPAFGHTLEKHFAVTSKPVIVLRNTSGRVEIKSWSKAEVMVIADHTGKSNVDIETEQAGERIDVSTNALDSGAKGADVTTNFTLMVPEESQLQIRTDSGSIVVESVHGDLSFETIAADVNLQNVGGYLVVRTTDGSVVCTRCDGSIRAESVSGNLQLFQPVMDRVTLHTTAGNILFDGDFLKHGVYLLKSDTGNTDIRFGRASSFDLTATSMHGTVQNEAKLQPDKHKKFHLPRMSSGFVSGSVGDGNAKVEVISFSGTIKILNR